MKTNFIAEKNIYYTLRIASAMCFIGHGAFGVITKPIWCNYFAVFGIGHDLAYQLMPIVGWVDIFFGISILIYPIRAVALWLVIWGIVTASLRPLSGEPFAELMERAGNFGAPLALLILCGWEKSISSWFKPLTLDKNSDSGGISQVAICLRIVVALLLLGHGWLNLIYKKGLIDQYTRLGFPNPREVGNIIGLLEVAAAFFVLIRPLAPLLLLLLIWKVTSEFFYPHYEIFEWVERGGSYGTLLALYFYVSGKQRNSNGFSDKRQKWNFGFS